MTNEEEVVTSLVEPVEVSRVQWKVLRVQRMARVPRKSPNKYLSEDFWRYACGYVQQRISGAFELDDVPFALFNLLLQGHYRVNIGLVTHASSARVASVSENALKRVPLTSKTEVPDTSGIAANPSGCLEGATS